MKAVLDDPPPDLPRKGGPEVRRSKLGAVGQVLGLQGHGAGGDGALSPIDLQPCRKEAAGVQHYGGCVRPQLHPPAAAAIPQDASAFQPRLPVQQIVNANLKL